MTLTEYVREHFLDIGVADCIVYSGHRQSFSYQSYTLCGASQLNPITRQPEHICPYQRGVIPFQTQEGQLLLMRCSLGDKIRRET
ncbi:MAG: hypothetical protein AABX72_01710 [Nanoarchaeota archaeon]